MSTLFEVKTPKHTLIYDEAISYMHFLNLYSGLVKYYANVEKLSSMIQLRSVMHRIITSLFGL